MQEHLKLFEGELLYSERDISVGLTSHSWFKDIDIDGSPEYTLDAAT